MCPFLSCITCSVLETANQTTNLALFLNCNQSHKAEQGRITSKPASSSHLLWTFAASCFTVPILPHNHILFLQGIILSFRNCRSHPKASFSWREYLNGKEPSSHDLECVKCYPDPTRLEAAVLILSQNSCICKGTIEFKKAVHELSSTPMCFAL